jgi:hypothetical protein
MNAATSLSEGQGGDFLTAENPAPKYKGKVVEIPVTGTWTPEQLQADYLKDCAHMTRTQLRKKYTLTYDSWKNMKQRAKEGAIIHQLFHDFVSFLRLVGPRLYDNYTLDRINNADSEYPPCKVQWRDKHAQNSNKSSNVILTDNTGVSHTVSQWANIKGMSADTIRKRVGNGWTPDEAIHGKAAGTSPLKAAFASHGEWADSPWPVGDELPLEQMYQATFFDGSNHHDEFGLPDITREEFYYAKVLEAHRAFCREQYCSGQNLWKLHLATARHTALGQTVMLPSAAVLEFQSLQSNRTIFDSFLQNAELHREFGKKRKAFFSSKWRTKNERRWFYQVTPRPPRFIHPPQFSVGQFAAGKQPDLLPSPFPECGTLQPGEHAEPTVPEGEEFFHGEVLTQEEAQP